MANKSKTSPGTIVVNRKARFDYHLGDRFEAGMVLEGWEVKSLRAGKIQLTDGYVLLKGGEAYLLGANITPLSTVTGYTVPVPDRTRKLLLNRHELSRLFSATGQKGKTCVPVSIYWKGNRVKCEIALAEGKKQHDKRASIKEREWNRDKQRIMRAR